MIEAYAAEGAEHGAAGAGHLPNPMHQFEIKRIIPLELFGFDASFTNSALFMFVLVLNMLGMVPYSFTVTSHIIVTFALAAFIFLGVTAAGAYSMLIARLSGSLRSCNDQKRGALYYD